MEDNTTKITDPAMQYGKTPVQSREEATKKKDNYAHFCPLDGRCEINPNSLPLSHHLSQSTTVKAAERKKSVALISPYNQDPGSPLKMFTDSHSLDFSGKKVNLLDNEVCKLEQAEEPIS